MEARHADTFCIKKALMYFQIKYVKKKFKKKTGIQIWQINVKMEEKNWMLNHSFKNKKNGF